MKRNLLTQIKNEWRDNIWLVVELTIVTGVIWLLCTMFYSGYKAYFLPKGFEYSNVYTLKTKTVPKSSPYFVAPSDEEEDAYSTDFLALLSRLRENPNVESVGFHHNATPYNYNFSGRNLSRLEKDDSIEYMGNVRHASPEISVILGYQSLTGKTPEQLAQILERGEILISDNWDYKDHGRDVMELNGTQVILGHDTTKVYRVGDIIRNVRRNDYEDTWGGTIVIPLIEKTQSWGGILIKVKEGHEQRFKEDFRNDKDLRHQRNVYLTDLTNFDDTREVCQRNYETNFHTIECLMLFLLVTIFLGLLGTFWFRIQQRVGEIAIRKTCGATKGDIFRRIMSEGLILLLIASVFMSAIIWPFSGTVTGLFECSRKELFVFELVAMAIVAVGIILSLWNPARKAMVIEPAIALKSE